MFLLLLLALLSITSDAQLSNPIALDRQIDQTSNKFLQRRADKDDAVPTVKYVSAQVSLHCTPPRPTPRCHALCSDEVLVSGECDANLALKWMTEVGSSIYATPLIHDLYSDGHKDILVPTFVHYLEVVEGSNGAKVAEDSWPAFHQSTLHASLLTFDFDFDNVPDILVATYDGEILFFKDTVSLSVKVRLVQHWRSQTQTVQQQMAPTSIMHL